MKENKFGRALDSLVSAVSPKAGLERALARTKLEIINSGYGNYGANHYKRTSRFNDTGGSAHEDIEDNIKTLRIRSRDQYMGKPIATAAINTKLVNVVGGGIMPTPLVDVDFLGLTAEQAADLQAQIVREFDLWADTPSCDADRLGNFYQLQQLAYIGYLMNGDAFALLGAQETGGQPYSLALRIVEADRVCSPHGADILAPAVVDGIKAERIVQGVETDESGTVKAYWIAKHHPLSRFHRSLTDEWTRVEAYGENTGRKNVLHIMKRERAGQLRGVPMLAPVLESVNQLGKYSQAELDAAVVAALQAGFITHTDTKTTPPFEMPGLKEEKGEKDEQEIRIASGAMIDLGVGEDIKFPVPGRPNANFAAFYNAVLEQMTAAVGIPAEVLNKKFQSNYSASRGALNEFWRVCETERDFFNECFNQPIYEEWFAEAVARGRIRAPGFFDNPAVRRAYTNCRWNGPARTNLNPKDEVEAAIMRVCAGFSTAEEETAQMTGGSYMNNIKQRMTEAQLQREVDEIAGTNAEEQSAEQQRKDAGRRKDDE